MRMRLSLAGLAAVAGLCLPAFAETRPVDCATLEGMLGSFLGTTLTAPPAGDDAGWCVLDGAALTDGAEDRPDITVRRLRVRGSEADGVPVSLDIDLAGLRVAPKVGDRRMDDRLRSLFRLQTADLRLSLSRNEAADRLELRGGRLALSGGTEVEFSADVAGAELSAAGILSGALTALDLTWKNDGRLPRPAMEMAGEKLAEGATGSAAVDAARAAVATFAEALPAASLAGDTSEEVGQLIDALPQGRGRLTLGFVSEGGIGAAQLGLAVLSDDPLGPATLGRLLAGSTITVDWKAGLVP